MHTPRPLTAPLGLALLFLLVASFSARAEASPFDARKIPAQAEAVVHVDLEKLRATGLWTIIVDALPDEARATLNGKLDGKTAARWQGEGTEGVARSLIGRARSAQIWSGGAESIVMVLEFPRSLRAELQKKVLSTLKTSIQNGVKLYHIDDDMVASLVGNSVVIANQPALAVTTVELHLGKGKSLAGDPLGRHLSSSKDAFVAAGLRGSFLETLKAAIPIPLPGELRLLTFVAGHKRKLYHGETDLQMDTAEAATKLAGMIKAFLNLASSRTDDPTAAAFYKGLTIKAQGAKITSRLELTEAVLTKIIWKK